MVKKDFSKTNICKFCKKKFHPNIQGKGFFCSLECSRKGRAFKQTKTITFNCEWCGKEKTHPLYWKSPHKFCSIQCMANARGEKMRGENHPKWKGGSVRTECGPICRKIKKEIKECKRCGSREKLQIHHKIPVSERPDLAADETNIEIICVQCHAKEHPEYKGMLLKIKERFAGICTVCGNEYFDCKSKIEKRTCCSVKCSIKKAKEKFMSLYVRKMDSGHAHEKGRIKKRVKSKKG